MNYREPIIHYPLSITYYLLGVSFAAAVMLPGVTFASEIGAEVQGLISRFVNVLVTPLVTGFFALAFLLFMWGLLMFMLSISGSNTDKTGPMATADGRRHMLWGLLGMVIMFSVGGIINVITNSLGDTGSDPIEIRGGFE